MFFGENDERRLVLEDCGDNAADKKPGIKIMKYKGLFSNGQIHGDGIMEL